MFENVMHLSSYVSFNSPFSLHSFCVLLVLREGSILCCLLQLVEGFDIHKVVGLAQLVRSTSCKLT